MHIYCTLVDGRKDMLKFHLKCLRSAYEIFNKALNVTPKTLTKCRLICVTQQQ